MRVIAGSLGGRVFDAPGTQRTHPMSDKIRGALFTMLGDLDGLTVCDAFAGSGALSFEAISRGATSVLALDSDRDAQRAITTNIAKLGLEKQVTLVRATANAWLQTNPHAQFDIMLCDPPHNDMQLSLLQRLAQAVTPEGLLVISAPASMTAPQFATCTPLQQRSYGNAQLLFYRAG